MTREEAIEILHFQTFVVDFQTGKALEMAISALRQQDVTDTDVGKNDPLTMDELRKMDGEPVYIVDGDLAWWDIVSHSTKYFLILVRDEAMPFIRYGKTWLAYRQKPEEGTV